MNKIIEGFNRVTDVLWACLNFVLMVVLFVPAFIFTLVSFIANIDRHWAEVKQEVADEEALKKFKN